MPWNETWVDGNISADLVIKLNSAGAHMGLYDNNGNELTTGNNPSYVRIPMNASFSKPSTNTLNITSSPAFTLSSGQIVSGWRIYAASSGTNMIVDGGLSGGNYTMTADGTLTINAGTIGSITVAAG